MAGAEDVLIGEEEDADRDVDVMAAFVEVGVVLVEGAACDEDEVVEEAEVTCADDELDEAEPPGQKVMRRFAFKRLSM